MIVDIAWYKNGIRQEATSDPSDLVALAKLNGGFVWMGLAEPSESEFDSISQEFNLHPLAIEDAVIAQQRPKLEHYENLHFLVVKTVFFNSQTNQISTGELMIFIGECFVLIVRHGEGSPLVNVRKDLEQKPEFLSKGPFAVVHGVMDKVIDEYSRIAAALETAVGQVEQKVFSGQGKSHSEQIYFLKREVIEYWHAIEPLTVPMQRLVAESSQILAADLLPFFRDLNDHLLRACSYGTSLDSLLTTVMHVDLAHIQMQQNIDVRRISAWVALASGPTMVAGIYGMNFEHMPELQWKYGYAFVVSSLVVLTGYLYMRFKRAKWL